MKSVVVIVGAQSRASVEHRSQKNKNAISDNGGPDTRIRAIMMMMMMGKKKKKKEKKKKKKKKK